jgi:hypothetical protein
MEEALSFARLDGGKRAVESTGCAQLNELNLKPSKHFTNCGWLRGIEASFDGFVMHKPTSSWNELNHCDIIVGNRVYVCTRVQVVQYSSTVVLINS